MKYTPDEIAELLKDKPHQPHYIAAMVRKAVEAERERCAKLVIDATAWCGGHGEPPCPGGSELARMLRAG